MTKNIAWITGASSGIGAATAKKLAKDGWIVCITARSTDKLNALALRDPDFIKAFPGDVTNADEMSALVDKIESDIGPIKMAVLNAGLFTPDYIEDFTADNFAKHMDVNVKGTGNCAAPIMQKFLTRRQGHLAITASVAGYRGLPRAISYSASKAALLAMAESIAVECHDMNIKVQVISPGFVKTPMTDQNDFEMPMIIEVEEAADALVKGLKSNRFEISFPFTFCLMMKFLKFLPAKLYR